MANQSPDHSVSNPRSEPIRIANPVRGRINACGFKLCEPLMHRAYRSIKVELFDALPNEIVEIGPGTGANLRYYRPGTRVIAIEPNVYMHRQLKRNAEKLLIDLSFAEGSGEAIDLSSDSVDAVVTSLVLCSVRDPLATVHEIGRILAPGGRYLFLEHVIACNGGVTRIAQKALHRPWKWLFEGCNLDRETDSTLRESGFQSVKLNRFQLRPAAIPFSPHIYGVATK